MRRGMERGTATANNMNNIVAINVTSTENNKRENDNHAVIN